MTYSLGNLTFFWIFLNKTPRLAVGVGCLASLVYRCKYAVGSRFSVLGSRLSVLGSRLSVVGCWLSVLGCRFSVVGSRLSVVGSRLSVVGSRLSVLGSERAAVIFFAYIRYAQNK